MMSNDRDFYDIFDGPISVSQTDPVKEKIEQRNLETVKEQAKEDIQSNKTQEKVYLVRGDKIFVCHPRELTVEKKTVEGEVVRTITLKDARMLIQTPEGLRKVDR